MSIFTRHHNEVRIVSNCGLVRDSNLPVPSRAVRVQLGSQVIAFWADMLEADEGRAEIERAIANAQLDLLSPDELKRLRRQGG